LGIVADVGQQLLELCQGFSEYPDELIVIDQPAQGAFALFDTSENGIQPSDGRVDIFVQSAVFKEPLDTAS
jgi:hypothetical protein